MTMGKSLPFAFVVILLAGCYNGGPYGYDQHYSPLDAEEEYFERASEAVYNDVRTDPEDFTGQLLSWFGIVEATETAGDATVVRMAFRTHQARHLCRNEERESCRVTVSQASPGSFSARIELVSDDLQGRNRIAPGSLLRVYCNITGEFDTEGGPLLECEHYRHWPRGQWAHTGMRSEMRR